jgi:hypothetical protein
MPWLYLVHCVDLSRHVELGAGTDDQKHLVHGDRPSVSALKGGSAASSLPLEPQKASLQRGRLLVSVLRRKGGWVPTEETTRNTLKPDKKFCPSMGCPRAFVQAGSSAKTHLLLWTKCFL